MVNPISIPLITAVIQQEGVSVEWQTGDRPLERFIGKGQRMFKQLFQEPVPAPQLKF